MVKLLCTPLLRPQLHMVARPGCDLCTTSRAAKSQRIAVATRGLVMVVDSLTIEIGRKQVFDVRKPVAAISDLIGGRMEVLYSRTMVCDRHSRLCV